MVVFKEMTEGLSFKGAIAADTIEVRYAFSGRVAGVGKKPGDRVKAGELLAFLETKMLETELAKELADYERARADFEIFSLKTRDPQTDVEKYEKTRMQALLDAAVKQVELAKYRLDQTQLTSPVEGIVISDGGLRPGLYITPGSYGFEILDLATLHFSAVAAWDQIGHYPEGTQVKIKIQGKDEELVGQVMPLLPQPKKGNALIRVKVDRVEGLWPGMEGSLRIES